MGQIETRRIPGYVRYAFVTMAFGALLSGQSVAHPTDNRTRWLGTWTAAPQPLLPGTSETFDNQTVRLIVHTSIGGANVRIKLSNTYSAVGLLVGAAHVARRTTGAEIDPGSDRILSFRGRRSVTIAPGAFAVSDPVALDVPARSDLAVSLFFPTTVTPTTNHLLARQTNFVSASGDVTGAKSFPIVRNIHSWPFLTGVEVETRGEDIVLFGDSLVDGDGSTTDINHRWPDLLAARLSENGNTRDLGVVNEGIIGNRLLQDSPATSPFGAALGEAGVRRFKRDVLDQIGVRYVIVRIGINDLGFPGALTPATQQPTAADLIAGYRRLIARARRSGLGVIGTTLTPFENASQFPGYYTAEKEALRQQVNAWIRNSHAFDAVIDLDAVLRDPADPARLIPAFDSGDHLHTNDAGYAASADATALVFSRR